MSPEAERMAEVREWLARVAWAIRYPGTAPAPAQDEADSAFELTTRMALAIASKLPAEAVPVGFARGSI